MVLISLSAASMNSRIALEETPWASGVLRGNPPGVWAYMPGANAKATINAQIIFLLLIIIFLSFFEKYC
jgi:hypothetical protein